MERFDFVSVMARLTQHISEDLYQNQTDLMDTLFADFINDSEFEFDNGLVNKWLRGKAKLSPQISLYYRKPKHQYALCTTIERTILPIMADPAMAAQEMYELLLQDSSVSPQKKEEFDENEDAASLITQLLCFAMSRNFEKWEQPEKQLKAPGGLSPVVSDLIIDNGIPKPCRWFRGRTRELEQLHDLLVSYDKVFLHGIPGIGKSEVAKAYAQQHRKDYTNILYIPCVDSLRQVIIDVDFVADLPSDTEEHRFKKHNRFLRSLREDTLIIIDNFNAMEDELLDVVCNYRCRVLFTTRNRFEHRTGLELRELDENFLFQIVEYFYSDAQKNREIVEGILEAVHCHTFAVELTARLMESGFLKPKRLLEKLQAEKTAMDADDTIRTAKDGKTGRATYHDHIHTLFALFRLSKKAQEILRNMTLMPVTGISARLFGRWLGLRNLNAVNDLIDIGMIQPGCCRMISLHPMIREVVMAEYPPSVTACETLLEGVLTVCRNHGRDVTFHRDMIQVIENIRSDAAKDDLSRYLRFLEGVYPYFDRYDYKNGKEQVINEITTILQDNTVGDEVDRAWLLNYRASREENPEKAIKLAQEAAELLGKKIDNAFLQELHKQVEKIAKAIMDTIPAIARGLESLRQKMVMYRYQIIHFRSAKWQAADELREVKPDLKRFDELVAEIKSKTREQKTLTVEKKQTPVWSLLKRNDLTKRITQLTEDLEELRSEKALLLARFDYTEDAEMKQAKARAKQKEKRIDDLIAKEHRCEQELDTALAEFQNLSQKASDYDPDKLWPERLKHRETMSHETEDQLKSHFGKSFSHRRLQSAASDVRMYLTEDERNLARYLMHRSKVEQQKKKVQLICNQGSER